MGDIFTLGDSVDLLYGLPPRLFGARVKTIGREKLDLSFEDEADRALLELSRDMRGGALRFPRPVQRVIYEKISMYISASIAYPEIDLSAQFRQCRTDEERISLLLAGEIRNMNLRALRPH